ncbi:MAG: hypothetical protein M3461_06920 [Pseudomonadota bacterium]|nr:hypothetical protein [Pseudomonadota bacterium]
MPLVIHCTQKLLAEIPDRFIDPSASGVGWHANLLRLERRKCVLFTHDDTLYSVFVPGLRKRQFEQLDEVFGQRLFKALVWDDFAQTQIERMLEACRVIRFTRSSNRSVLGSMNDIRFQIGSYVEHDGGLTSADLAQLHHALNRIPFSAIGYGYSVERLQEYLARAPDSSAAGDEGGGQSGSDSRVRDRS